MLLCQMWLQHLSNDFSGMCLCSRKIRRSWWKLVYSFLPIHLPGSDPSATLSSLSTGGTKVRNVQILHPALHYTMALKWNIKFTGDKTLIHESMTWECVNVTETSVHSIPKQSIIIITTVLRLNYMVLLYKSQSLWNLYNLHFHSTVCLRWMETDT